MLRRENAQLKIQVTPDEYQQLMKAAGQLNQRRDANEFLLGMQWAEEVTKILRLTPAQSQMIANATTEVVVRYEPFDRESLRFLPRTNPFDPAWMLWQLLEGARTETIAAVVSFLSDDDLRRLSMALSQFSQIVAQVQSEQRGNL